MDGNLILTTISDTNMGKYLFWKKKMLQLLICDWDCNYVYVSKRCIYGYIDIACKISYRRARIKS